MKYEPKTSQGVTIRNGNKLSQGDIQFVKFLIEDGLPLKAYERLIEWEAEKGFRTRVDLAKSTMYTSAAKKLQDPDIQAEYWRQMQEVREHDVADATEVMRYFTQVMRGEIKDQFGLDASLSDRTTAAKELAKRTIDMENRMQGKPDAVVSIKLDWER